MPRKAIAAFGASTWGLGAAGGLVVLAFVSFGAGPDFGLRAAYSTATQQEVATRAAPPPVDSTARTFDTEGSGSGDRVNSMVFTDVTRIAGITYLHTVPDPLLGKPEPADMLAGAVAEDFDSDGWVDLFVLRGGKAPSLLYMNQGDGTITEESKARGAALPTKLGAAAAAAEFDNDGDIDIVVANQKAPHYLLINGGTGQFAVDGFHDINSFGLGAPQSGQPPLAISS